MQKDQKIQKVKVIMLGDSCVGKTSLINAFRNQPMSDHYEPTVGIDFFSKNIKTLKLIDYDSMSEGSSGQISQISIIEKLKQQKQTRPTDFKLQFWDTAGQQRFRCIIPSYIRNSAIGVIVYDIANKKSFENIQSWLQDFRQYAPQNALAVLVGNKIDLAYRIVTTEQAKAKASKLGIYFTQVSAKMKTGIDSLQKIFLQILEDDSYPKLIEKHETHEINSSRDVLLSRFQLENSKQLYGQPQQLNKIVFVGNKINNFKKRCCL